MKVAVLSNINADSVNRQLNTLRKIEIYKSQGYGNELGVLLNSQSSLYRFKPEIVFILMDIMELIGHNLEISEVEKRIDEWFSVLEYALNDNIIYYLSDAYLYGFEMGVVWNTNLKTTIEALWDNKLYKLIKNQSNVRIFPYRKLIQKLGEENAFSSKMWYMGKILYSTMLQKTLAEEIKHKIDLEKRQPKKVLLLDLDNTLWRGLAGENDITPIILSEDGVGLAYKNFQRIIKQLKIQGVILGIVSKNNLEDAMSIINNHPHMVLRLDDFVVSRINWENKAKNILSICEELNIGLDSIVFIDDSKVEQALVREALPEVLVPDFPDRSEDLTSYMIEIYHDYFEKSVVTQEDKEKTNLYRANIERKRLQDTVVDFDSYLDSLEMKIYRVNVEKNRERFVQLINKTNQFNLTTRRFTEQEIAQIIQDENKEIFLYKVVDKFGDNGIVAAAIVEYGKKAVIVEFTMSCRVMGRKIEDAIIEDIESSAKQHGYDELIGIYKPTEKNQPVKDLYSSFGYKIKKVYDDGKIEYLISLETILRRRIHAERIKEN